MQPEEQDILHLVRKPKLTARKSVSMATNKGKVMEKEIIELKKGEEASASSTTKKEEEASASSTTMKEEEASASSTTKKEEEASASSTTMKRPASLPAPKDEADPEKGKDEEAAKEDVSTDFGKMSQAQIAKMMEKVWESSGVKERMDQMKKQSDILTEVNKGLQQQIQNSERFATPASYRMTPRMRGHQEEHEQPEEGWRKKDGRTKSDRLSLNQMDSMKKGGSFHQQEKRRRHRKDAGRSSRIRTSCHQRAQRV